MLARPLANFVRVHDKNRIVIILNGATVNFRVCKVEKGQHRHLQGRNSQKEIIKHNIVCTIEITKVCGCVIEVCKLKINIRGITTFAVKC